jgi:hypothetical protein
MKNLKIILIIMIGIGILVSCQKAEKDPVLDISKTVLPAITSPADGYAMVLLKEQKDSLMMAVEWTPTQYNLSDLETTKYILQMDLAGNNFANPVDLASTEEISVSTTVGQFNNTLLSVLELTPEESHAL